MREAIFPWSSAATHTGGSDPVDLPDLKAYNDMVSGVNFKEMVTEADNKEAVASLRLHWQIGRPLTRDSFLGELEHTLGRQPVARLASGGHGGIRGL